MKLPPEIFVVFAVSIYPFENAAAMRLLGEALEETRSSWHVNCINGITNLSAIEQV
jgi:hypothetical protein